MKKIIYVCLTVFVFQVSNAQKLALVKLNNKYGYVDTKGKMVIQPTFDNAESFSSGLAVVEVDGLFGFIDTLGTIIIKPKYTKAHSFNDNHALVSKDKEWVYINKKGKVLKTDEFEERYDFNEGVAVVVHDNKFGMIDQEGKMFVGLDYDKILPYKNGYAKFYLNGKWGLLDKSGKVFLKEAYDFVSYPSLGIVTVKNGHSCGVLSLKSKKFNEVEGAIEIEGFDDEQNLTYAMNSEEKIGFINRTGEWVIQPQYKSVRRFSQGLAGVSRNGYLWGFVNEKGEGVITPRFIDALSFNEGYVFIRGGSSRSWGVINMQGMPVIDDKYEIYSMYFKFKKAKTVGFVDGITRVGLNDKWGFIDINGSLIGGVWFESAERFVHVLENN